MVEPSETGLGKDKAGDQGLNFLFILLFSSLAEALDEFHYSSFCLPLSLSLITSVFHLLIRPHLSVRLRLLGMVNIQVYFLKVGGDFHSFPHNRL